MLLLDEAHAVGVIGANGRGLAEKLGLAAEIEIQMGTLSKALGVSGGYICGSRAADRSADQPRALLHLLHRAAARARRGGHGRRAVSALARRASGAGRNCARRLSLFAEEMPKLFPPGKQGPERDHPDDPRRAEAALGAPMRISASGLLRAGDPLSHGPARPRAAARDLSAQAHARADPRPLQHAPTEPNGLGGGGASAEA